MLQRIHLRRTFAVFAVCGLLLLPAAGCVGTLAQLMYASGGNMIPAEYKGDLKGKKVAVVCVSRVSADGRGEEATKLARSVEKLLKAHIPRIKIIGQDKINHWIDNHNWNEINYRELGKGVKAEILIAIDLENYSLRDSPALWRGSADFRVKAYDMTSGGKIVFSKSPPTHKFPAHGGRFRDTTSAQTFERQYLTTLAEQIARSFYAYPYVDDFGEQARFQGD